MKNMLGLAIALSLALVAALLNWKYLDRKSQELETIEFLAVKADVRIAPTDTFMDTHFVPISIPIAQADGLETTAVFYRDRSTVIGGKAVKRYKGGEIILRQDLKTPQAEMDLKENEVVYWVPVDTSTFRPSLVKPGDMVSFVVPKTAANGPQGSGGIDPEIDNDVTLQDGVPRPPNESLPSNDMTDLLGPFRVVSLGDRLGDDEVYRATNSRSTSENVIGIAAKLENDGNFGAAVQNLNNRLQLTNTRQVRVVLHPEAK